MDTERGSPEEITRADVDEITLAAIDARHNAFGDVDARTKREYLRRADRLKVIASKIALLVPSPMPRHSVDDRPALP